MAKTPKADGEQEGGEASGGSSKKKLIIIGGAAVAVLLVGGGAAFSTKGIDQSPWVILGGLGYVMTKNKNVEVSARYDFETRSSEFTNQTASINLRIPF